VTVNADGRAFEAALTLEEGKTTRLGQPQLAVAQVQPAVARGGQAAAAEPATAAEPTTVGQLALTRSSTIGGYGGFAMRYGRLDGRDGFFAGAEGGVVINHKYIVGLAAMGGGFGDPQDPGGSVGMGFAALVLRYRFLFEGSPFDVTAGVVAGPGGMGRERAGMPDQQGFIFVLEPQVEGHVNLTRWLRLGADVGYRLVASGGEVSSSDLRGLTTGVHAQVGWF
jgi:hypothetical protein